MLFEEIDKLEEIRDLLVGAILVSISEECVKKDLLDLGKSIILLEIFVDRMMDKYGEKYTLLK